MESTQVQSSDIPANNPLDITASKQKRPVNPKLLALAILSTIILFLLVAAIIKTSIPHPNNRVAVPTPTTVQPTPSIQIQELIPDHLKSSFNQIDQTLDQVNPPIPPQIDDNISP